MVSANIRTGRGVIRIALCLPQKLRSASAAGLLGQLYQLLAWRKRSAIPTAKHANSMITVSMPVTHHFM